MRGTAWVFFLYENGLKRVAATGAWVLGTSLACERRRSGRTVSSTTSPSLSSNGYRIEQSVICRLQTADRCVGGWRLRR